MVMSLSADPYGALSATKDNGFVSLFYKFDLLFGDCLNFVSQQFCFISLSDVILLLIFKSYLLFPDGFLGPFACIIVECLIPSLRK